MDVKLSLDSRYLIDNLGRQESMRYILTELMRINDVRNLQVRMPNDLAERAIYAFKGCIDELTLVENEYLRRCL